MAIRNIRELGDDILRKNCREVKEMTPKIQELIDDMYDTMYEAMGVGLAAPQVGIFKRIVVIDGRNALYHDQSAYPGDCGRAGGQRGVLKRTG